jgi:hypothetical protein
VVEGQLMSWPVGFYLVSVGGRSHVARTLTGAKSWADGRNRLRSPKGLSGTQRVLSNAIIVEVGTDTWYHGRATIKSHGVFRWTRYPRPMKQGCPRGR